MTVARPRGYDQAKPDRGMHRLIADRRSPPGRTGATLAEGAERPPPPDAGPPGLPEEASSRPGRPGRDDDAATGQRAERDMRSEVRRLKEVLLSSAQSAFAREIWEFCGIEAEHVVERVRRQQLAQLIHGGLLRRFFGAHGAGEDAPRASVAGASARRARGSRLLRPA